MHIVREINENEILLHIHVKAAMTEVVQKFMEWTLEVQKIFCGAPSRNGVHGTSHSYLASLKRCPL